MHGERKLVDMARKNPPDREFAHGYRTYFERWLSDNPLRNSHANFDDPKSQELVGEVIARAMIGQEARRNGKLKVKGMSE